MATQKMNPAHDAPMRIGAFARRAGLSVRAVRYYEEMRLIQPKGHSAGGFRLYGEDSLKRLELIGFLKGLNLTLADIRQMLFLGKEVTRNKSTVRQLRKVFAEKLRLAEDRIEALQAIKSDISWVLGILENCESCNREILLDEQNCIHCASRTKKRVVPEIFKIVLQRAPDSRPGLNGSRSRS
jgi:MerR family transcriptional regulator, copper efflux regulator